MNVELDISSSLSGESQARPSHIGHDLYLLVIPSKHCTLRIKSLLSKCSVAGGFKLEGSNFGNSSLNM